MPGVRENIEEQIAPGFGSVNNEQIDSSTFDTVSAGLH
eukprot:COSAG01_NODE_6359_length_3713_cov_34.765634_4_plen_38_part_00